MTHFLTYEADFWTFCSLILCLKVIFLTFLYDLQFSRKTDSKTSSNLCHLTVFDCMCKNKNYLCMHHLEFFLSPFYRLPQGKEVWMLKLRPRSQQLIMGLQSRPIKMRTPILYLANRQTNSKMLLTPSILTYFMLLLFLPFH